MKKTLTFTELLIMKEINAKQSTIKIDLLPLMQDLELDKTYYYRELLLLEITNQCQ